MQGRLRTEATNIVRALASNCARHCEEPPARCCGSVMQQQGTDVMLPNHLRPGESLAVSSVDVDYCWLNTRTDGKWVSAKITCGAGEGPWPPRLWGDDSQKTQGFGGLTIVVVCSMSPRRTGI